MKALLSSPISTSLLVAFLFISSIQLSAAPLPEADPCFEPPRWEKLGQRKVNRGLDHDEIFVTAKDGLFRSIKLKVRKSGINLHKVVIHFGNGETQNVAVRNNIRAGGETRIIDINGGKRVIKKVVFWYDTKGIVNNKAVLELWGRH